MSREEILARFIGDDKILAAKVFDWAYEVMRENDYRLSPLLDPQQQELVTGIIREFPGLAWRSFGGYQEAERKRIAIIPDFFPTEELAWDLAAVWIKGEFTEPLSHRDYLGALLNLGITRDSLGDLLVLPDGCQAICQGQMASFISEELERVGRYHVTVEPMDLERLTPPGQRSKEIRTTVASLRLDAVASAGFGLSRTKLARLVEAGMLKVNWQPTTSPSFAISEGDVISLRGRGRIVLREVGGVTRKKRRALTIERYL